MTAMRALPFLILLLPAVAAADTVRGTITSQRSGAALEGATIVVTGPDGTQATAITDASGNYTVEVVPGEHYKITVYYADTVQERANVAVAGEAVVNIPMPDSPVYTVEGVNLTAGSVASSMEMGSMRSNASSWLILPRGSEATGELIFLTADAQTPDSAPVRLTDIVIARASLRRSFGGKVELTAGIDGLPKQPSTTDELVWQGADLSARIGFKTKYAAYVNAGGGPLVADQGWWASTGVGVQRRAIVHETMSFQLAAGGSMTPLFFDGGEASWLGEVVVRGQTLFRVEGYWGLWFGADFAFPVAHSDQIAGMDFDPQPRVDLTVGTVYSVVENWDVYMQLGVIDRGDPGLAETQLPILLGGSDQTLFTFGITRHFGQTDGRDDMHLAY
jgi:hypothetical protein